MAKRSAQTGVERGGQTGAGWGWQTGAGRGGGALRASCPDLSRLQTELGGVRGEMDSVDHYTKQLFSFKHLQETLVDLEPLHID